MKRGKKEKKKKNGKRKKSKKGKIKEEQKEKKKKDLIMYTFALRIVGRELPSNVWFSWGKLLFLDVIFIPLGIWRAAL